MELAEKQIARLLEEYVKNSKLADEFFIDQVIIFLMYALEIENEVSFIKYNVDQEFLGAYDFFSRTIYVDLNRLSNHLFAKFEAEKNNGIINTSHDLILKYNLAFINTIAHELFHALQYKKIFVNNKDLETDLLKLSFEHNIMVIESELKKTPLSAEQINYIKALGIFERDLIYLNALPSERMACINASRVEKNIANLILANDKIKDYVNLKYKMEKIRGYLNGNCPTAYIMSVHNKLKNAYGLAVDAPEKLYANEKECLKIASENQLSLDDRYYYGMYVTGEELKPAINQINSLTRKITNNS